MRAGCGGCVPLVTNIYKAEMKKAGHATNNKCVVLFRSTRTRAEPSHAVSALTSR